MSETCVIPSRVKLHFETVLRDRVKNPISIRCSYNTVSVTIYGDSVSVDYTRLDGVDELIYDVIIGGPLGTDDVTVVMKPGGETILVINSDCGEEDDKEECDALYSLKRDGRVVLLRSLVVTANYPRRGRTTLTMIFEIRGGEP